MFAGIIMSGCIVQGVLGGCVEVGVVSRFAYGGRVSGGHYSCEKNWFNEIENHS